jgi:hypothetical protein
MQWRKHPKLAPIAAGLGEKAMNFSPILRMSVPIITLSPPSPVGEGIGGFSWPSAYFNRYNRNYNPDSTCYISYISDGTNINIIRFKNANSAVVHTVSGTKMPIVGYDGTLYIPTDTGIRAVDGSTYETKWTTNLFRYRSDYPNTEVVDICIDGKGYIYALFLETGGAGQEQSSIQKISESDGSIEWHTSLAGPLYGRPTSPITYSEMSDRVYFGMATYYGTPADYSPKIVCVNSNGNVVWSYELRWRVDDPTHYSSERCQGGIAVDDNEYLYFGTDYFGVNPPLDYRGIYSLDMNGSLRWYCRADGAVDCSGAEVSTIVNNYIRSAPSIDKNGYIYFTTDENAFGGAYGYIESRNSDGDVRFNENIYSAPLGGYTYQASTPCIVKYDSPAFDRIYVVTSGRRLHGFNETGAHFLNVATSQDAMSLWVTSKKDGVIWTIGNPATGTYYISIYNKNDGSLVYETSGSSLWKRPVLVNSYAFEDVADCPIQPVAGTGAGGKGYVVDTYATNLYEYDPATNTWSAKASPPVGGAGVDRSYFFFFGIGDKVYLAGGADEFGFITYTDVWVYNPSTNSWTQLNDTPEATFMKTGFGHPYVDGSYAYLPCTIDSTGYIRLYKYDPSTDSWTRLTDCPASERYDYMIAGRIVGAGYDWNTGDPLSDCYIYDPSTDSWSSIASHPQSGTAVFGYDLHAALEGSRMIYEYNPSTNSWSSKALYIGVGDYSPGFTPDSRSWLINSTAYFTTYTGSVIDVLKLRI